MQPPSVGRKETPGKEVSRTQRPNVSQATIARDTDGSSINWK